MAKSLDVVQGTLDLLILKALSVESFHGWGISARIQELSGNVFNIGQGSLYPALHRMEERGWVESFWGTSDKGKRAKFYRITQPGRRALKTETESWNQYVTAVAGVMAS